MHSIAKRKKLILENIKTNNSGEADKPRVSLAREKAGHVFKKKSLSVCAELLRMLREGKKRVFDMGKVSGSFQTARKHQADSLILYIPPLRGGDIIIAKLIFFIYF